MLVEGSVGDLAELRAVLPPTLAATLPETETGLLENTCAGLPAAVRARVGAAARAAFVVVRGTDGLGFALAVRVRTEPGAAPLAADAALGALDADGAPSGGRWLGGAPAEDRPALALLGDVLVCAQDASDARAAGPYLARTLVPSTEGAARVAALPSPPNVLGAPIVAVAVAGTVARDVRTSVDRSLADLAANLSDSAQRAVDAHATPAVLGDPVALVSAVRARLQRLAAYLPDVGAVRGTLAPGGGGLVVSLQADVASGSPLDAALDALPTVDPRQLGALPRGTAVAALLPAEPTATRAASTFGAALVDDLTRVAGARLSPDDALEVRAALAEVGRARGTSLLAALGRGLGGPFALLASAGISSPPAPATLIAALGAAYPRGALGLALGCSGDAAPRPLSAPIALGGASLRMLDVCGAHAPPIVRDAPARSPRLDVASQGEAWALAITQVPAGTLAGPLSSIAARVSGTLAGVDDGATLAASPDAARALAALPHSAILALALVPERLLAAASLFPVDVLVRAGNEAAEPPPGAPLLLALAREGATLHLTLVLPTSALVHAAETYATASSLAP